MSAEALQDLVYVRQVDIKDIDFILHSSVNCLTRYYETINSGLDNSYSYDQISKLFKRTILNKRYETYICHARERYDEILGYIIANPYENHIFFNYTKYLFRQRGIQKHLLIPLVVDPHQLVTLQWPTKQALKMKREKKVNFRNIFWEELTKDDVMSHQEME